MSHADTRLHSGFDLVGMLARLRETLTVQHARRVAYIKTYNELSALSARELADIGIGASQIEEIAREAARMAA